jgi:HlyD family secretion protein
MTNKRNAAKIIIAIIVVGLAALLIKRIFFQPRFRYAGTLEATKIDLSSQLASTIAAIKPQEGDRVKTGEELVRLSCEDVKVAAELADSNYRRNRRLLQAGTISPETMDQVKNRKEDSDVKLSWCAIASPIDGIVLSRYHEPREWVTPGTKILTLANVKDIWAFIYVPQPEVARLQPGMKLEGRLPELNDRRFTGTIIKINDEAEFTPKNVQTRQERTRLVFGVKVSFLGYNDDETLKPGMTIEVLLPR